jgi:hypothetical protein
MKLRKLLLAGSAFALMTVAPAQASIVDNPHFKVLGLVIVWGNDGTASTAPVVSDFVIDSAVGAGDADLIAGNVHTVVTGSLTPTPDSLAGASPFNVANAVSGGVYTDAAGAGAGFLDATDSFTAFQIDGTTDINTNTAVFNSSFYVASNTAFAINAQATAATATNFTLANVGYSLAIDQAGNDGLAYGANSQLPHTGNTTTSGVVTTVNDLGDMSAVTNVFTGNRRTAASVGTIASQSVRFDSVYTLGGTAGYDLSMGTGEIEANVTYTVYVP